MQIRDWIVEGSIYMQDSSDSTYRWPGFLSGNYRKQTGFTENVNLTGGRVYTLDPLFVDSANDNYRLSRKGNGQSANSPLIETAFYYFSIEPVRGDMGAYSTDWSGV